jgi:gamma-glutamylcyclotransferase (GGCT)/AIG2-like uncharacterized protein YtfP
MLLFVYGSLKRGKRLSLEKVEGAKFVSEATTMHPTFDMIDLGSYPGVIEDRYAGYKIVGEVFSITPQLLDQVDEIEGYPSFYNRIRVDTTVGEAWMYVLDRTDRMLSSVTSTIKKKKDTLTWCP